MKKIFLIIIILILFASQVLAEYKIYFGQDNNNIIYGLEINHTINNNLLIGIEINNILKSVNKYYVINNNLYNNRELDIFIDYKLFIKINTF
jgi:hypothetical protein